MGFRLIKLPGVEVMPFSPDMLPTALRGFVEDTAGRIQCPPDYLAVSAVILCGAMLGRSYGLAPKSKDNWAVYPNLWGGCVGAPSSKKSPPISAALKPVTELQKLLSANYQELVSTDRLLANAYKRRQSSAEKEAAKFLDEGNTEDAVAAMRAAEPVDESPTEERLYANDATFEKLGELMSENNNGIVMIRDELAGLLLKLTREDAAVERAFLLECFDAINQFIFDRIGRGTITIPSPMLSILGGIQPPKLAVLVTGALNGDMDDGLLQRLQLLVWPAPVSSTKWVDREPNALAYKAYEDAIRRLYTLRKSGEEKPSVLRFTSEAQAVFIQWWETLQQEIETPENHPAFQSYLLKFPRTICSLALIFELVEGGQKEISLGSLEIALRWSDYLISHARRIYSLAATSVIDHANTIIKHKAKLPAQFTVRDVRRKHWSGLTSNTSVADALEVLVDEDYLLEIRSTPKAGGGRPTTKYAWNPARDGGSPEPSAKSVSAKALQVPSP